MSILIISLDFELRWGLLDKLQLDIEKYKDNLLSVHENIPWMLKIFQERNIAATWATVGAVGCDNWEEFDIIKPKIKPSYKNKKLIYDNNFNREIDPNGKLYFAPNLIKSIINTPKQELGMHTFGHIYGTEPDVTYEELKHDLLTCKQFFSKKFGYSSESLVFPRNQVIYADRLIEDKIIKTYRGNEPVSYLSTNKQRKKQFINRAKIFLDSLNPFNSHKYYIDEIIKGDIRSSAMIRIYLKNQIIRSMHLYKLKRNIVNLKEEEIYHIWLHPHNIGKDQQKKDDFLKFFDFLGNRIVNKNLKSYTMNDLLQMYSNPIKNNLNGAKKIKK